MASISNYRFYFTEDRRAWFSEKEKAGGGMLFNLGVHRKSARTGRQVELRGPEWEINS